MKNTAQGNKMTSLHYAGQLRSIVDQENGLCQQA